MDRDLASRCFLCQDSIPGFVGDDGIVKILQDFYKFTKELGGGVWSKLSGKWEGDDDNDNMKSFCSNANCCSDCAMVMECVMEEKEQVDLVEASVRKLQLELLVELRRLQEKLASLHGKMTRVEGRIYLGGNRRSGRGDGPAVGFRKGVMNAVEVLKMFNDKITPRVSGRSTNIDGISEDDTSLLIATSDVIVKVENEEECILFDEDPNPDLPQSPDYVPSDGVSSESDRESDNNLSEESQTSEDEDFTPKGKSKPQVPRKKRRGHDPTTLPQKISSVEDSSSPFKFPCTKCSKAFKDSRQRRRHMDTHLEKSQRETAQCSECGKTVLALNLHNHKRKNCPARKRDAPTTPTGTTFPCTSCSRTYDALWRLDVHIKRVHSNLNLEPKQDFKCDTCGKIFISSFLLQRHQDRGHQNTKTKKFYHCQFCKLAYRRKKDLKAHLSANHAEDVKKLPPVSKFPCPVCGKPCQSKVNLRLHQESHLNAEEREKINCEICGRSFFKKSYNNHRLYNCKGAEEQGIVCEHCGKPFKNWVALKFHVRNMHEGNGETFSCHLCGKDGIRTKGILRAHLRRHTDKREFICERCGRDFKFGADLRKHKRGCDGSKPPRKLRDDVLKAVKYFY